MTNIKKKIMDILSNFEDSNLASEGAREVIADRLMQHIFNEEDNEFQEEIELIGESLLNSNSLK